MIWNTAASIAPPNVYSATIAMSTSCTEGQKVHKMDTDNFLRLAKRFENRPLRTLIHGDAYTFTINDGALSYSSGGDVAVEEADLTVLLERLSSTRSIIASSYADISSTAKYFLPIANHLWRAAIDEAGHVLKAHDVRFVIEISTIDPDAFPSEESSSSNAGFTKVTLGRYTHQQLIHYILAGAVALDLFNPGSNIKHQPDYKLACDAVPPPRPELRKSPAEARAMAIRVVDQEIPKVRGWFTDPVNLSALKYCASYLWDNLTLTSEHVAEQLAIAYGR